MNFKNFLVTTLLIFVIAPNSALAEDKEVPLNLQIKHLFTALQYDNNFQTRTEDTLKIGILYISSGRKSIIRNVTKLTQSKQLFSFTSHPEYVSECGVSMAVGYKQNNPKIYLNLSSAKAEGTDFNAKFLRVAYIVGESK